MNRYLACTAFAAKYELHFMHRNNRFFYTKAKAFAELKVNIGRFFENATDCNMFFKKWGADFHKQDRTISPEKKISSLSTTHVAILG